MTRQEASERYNIPISVLRAYESWGICGGAKTVSGVWQYDDEDLERLNTILTLYDMGFTAQETETYMRLLLEQPDSASERLRMVEKKRSATLDEIHLHERQLERLDYLRHEMQKNREH